MGCETDWENLFTEKSEKGYYRYPCVHKDVVLFCCEDDLWTVSITGGYARRLTTFPGVVSYPILSRDGKFVCFTVTDEGYQELYVMRSTGGSAKRMTFLGAAISRALAWTSDGESVVFTSSHNQTMPTMRDLFHVAMRGGTVVKIGLGLADHFSFNPISTESTDSASSDLNTSGLLLGRHTGDICVHEWKRYRGGRQGELWLDKTGNCEFKKIPVLEGIPKCSPVWVGKRIYFTSDHLDNQPARIFSCDVDGSDLTQHTYMPDGFYARDLQTDGNTIVFHAGGALYAHDVASGVTFEIDITWTSQRSQREKRLMAGGEYLNDCVLHPEGHSLAVTARGQAFTMGLWHGAALRFEHHEQSSPSPMQEDSQGVHSAARTQGWESECAGSASVGPSVQDDTDEGWEDSISVSMNEKLSITTPLSEDELTSSTAHRHACTNTQTAGHTLAQRTTHTQADESIPAPSCTPTNITTDLQSPTSTLRVGPPVAPPHGRYKLVRYVAGGQKLLMSSDSTGEEGLEIHFVDQTRQSVRLSLDEKILGSPVEMETSPTDPYAAIVNNRNELLLLDLITNTIVRVDVCTDTDAMCNLEFSPCGSWLAYEYKTARRQSVIKVCDIGSGECLEVTHGHHMDTSPSWDPDGLYLYFISSREYEPYDDEVREIGMGFAKAQKPHLVTLRADVANPLLPELRAPGDDDDDNSDDDDDSDADGSDSDEGTDIESEDEAGTERAGWYEGVKVDDRPEAIVIDFKNIGNRVLALPVPTRRYGQLVGLKERCLMYTTFSDSSLPVGFDEDSDDECKGNDSLGVHETGQLRRFDMRDLHETPIMEGSDVSWFTLSHDLATMLVFSDGELRCVAAGESGNDDDNVDSDVPSRLSGLVDVDRLVLDIDPCSEWIQMYLETWRAMRDKYYRADMRGVDWEAKRDLYLPLLRRASCRSEVSDIITELQSEMSTSHAFEYGGDYTDRRFSRPGRLGADFVWDEEYKGYALTHIVKGDIWHEKNGGPLAKPNVGVRKGDVLVAINRRRLSKQTSPNEMLLGLERTEVLLSFVKRPRTKVKSTAVPTPSTLTDAPTALRDNSTETQIHALSHTAHAYMHVRPHPHVRTSPSPAETTNAYSSTRSHINTKAHSSKPKSGKSVTTAPKRSSKRMVSVGKDKKEKPTRKSNSQTEKEGMRKHKKTGSAPAKDIAHRVHVRVKCIDSDLYARYRDHITDSRAMVNCRTKGRVGYVHLPDMERLGFSEFHRHFHSESRREGLIIDVRGNTGGYISELLLKTLAMPNLAVEISRYGVPVPYPTASVSGAMVMVCDEFTGSDGDCIVQAFKTLKLGPVVGRRTWGGVVGMMEPSLLVDGSQATQPEIAIEFLDESVGAIENRGVEPDISVLQTPQDYMRARDTTLEEATRVILEKLAAQPNPFTAMTKLRGATQRDVLLPTEWPFTLHNKA
eukprot:CFRG0721T1